LLVPFSFYQWGKLANFPSYTILVNTFVPWFLFYTGVVLVRSSAREKLAIAKDMLRLKMLVPAALFILAFSWLIQLLAPFVGTMWNFFISILFLFLLILTYEKLFRVRYTSLATAIAVLALVVDHSTILSMAFMKRFLIMMLLFVFLRFFILNLTYRLFTRPVYIEDLEEGMIPAENFILEDKRYQKRRILPISFISGLIERTRGRELFRDVPRGLSKEEISNVKRLHSHGSIKDHAVRVHHTMHFAPLMFLGVLLTILSKGSIVAALRALVENFI
jgi:hypothetical protein